MTTVARCGVSRRAIGRILSAPRRVPSSIYAPDLPVFVRPDAWGCSPAACSPFHPRHPRPERPGAVIRRCCQARPHSATCTSPGVFARGGLMRGRPRMRVRTFLEPRCRSPRWDALRMTPEPPYGFEPYLLGYKPSVLPETHRRRGMRFRLFRVGMARFERAASRSRTARAANCATSRG